MLRRACFSGVEVAEKGRDDDGLSETAREMRQAQPYLAAVWKMVGGTVVGVVGGYFLDKLTGWTPWGMVGLSLVGICVGFYGFIHDMLRQGKR
jgi:ATP synthase protein I